MFQIYTEGLHAPAIRS